MTSTLAPSYSIARSRFLAAATSAGASITSAVLPDHRGPDDEELTIEVAQCGPADASSVLLIVSGTHGVEGYAGSALQSRWLERRAEQTEPPSGPRVVMIHGLNPFGFAWHRRTNEDNIDLNRNFIDWSADPPDNTGYDELAHLLVPEQWTDQSQAETTAAVLEIAERVGLEELQRIITGGQYRHGRGLFYGGQGPAWSHRWLVENLPSLVGPADRLGIIDLHTGLGPWGVGELIVHAGRNDPVYARAAQWWGDVRSMSDGESVSAKLDGDWLGSVPSLVPSVELTASALEFGTIDEVSVLQSLRGEAWAHGRDDVPAEHAARIRADVRAAFADDDPAWLEILSARFDEVATAAERALS